MASEKNSKDSSGEPETASHAESSSTEPLKSGVCKWFNVLKGWGFITPDDGSQEVFVHQSVIRMPGFRSLGEGERVEFQSHQTDRGVEATMVTGPTGGDCQGSTVRPLGKKKFRRIRCFNCGQFGNHIASKCRLGQLPKSCYHCKGSDHLIADCPQRPKEAGESSAAVGSSSDSGREETDQSVSSRSNQKNHVQSEDVASARREETAKPVEKKTSAA